MVTHTPNYLQRKLNAHLDGKRFFDHWKEKFRNSQVQGVHAKCLCPFHSGGDYRSFLLDLSKKTYRCTFTQCKATAGGTFADLQALFTGKGPHETLLDLCSAFQIAVPDELATEIAEHLAERVRELIRENKLKAAENLAVLAFKENPTNTMLRLLLADICELSGRPAAARPYYELVLEEAVGEKDWNRATTILERLRSLYPNETSYVEQSLKIAEARGDRAQAVTCYLILAHRSDISLDLQRNWLEKARRLDPSRPEILERLGLLYEQIGQPDQAVGCWDWLAEHYRSTGEWAQALNALTQMARVCPERDDVAERRAEVLLQAGQTQEAVEILKRLTEQALRTGTADRAERYLRRLCNSGLGDVGDYWQLLTLFEQSQRIEDASFIADRMLELCDPNTAGERYVAVLERLKRWHPNSTVYRGQLASHLANRGDTDAAFTEMRELIDLCFQRGLRIEALQRIQGMRGFAADRPHRWLEIAQLLATHGCTQEALREYETLARKNLSRDRSLAEEACRLGLELDSSRPTLHEILLQLYLPDAPDRAFEQCRRIVELYRSQGTVEKAFVSLERFKQRLPTEVEPRLLSVGLAVESGQPERAIQDLGELSALELTPEQMTKALDAANAVAERYGQRVQLLQVLAAFHRRRNDADSLVETLLRLASAQSSINAAGAAEATYSEILAVRPNEARALLARAELVRTTRGKDAARPLYLRYIEQMLADNRRDEALRIYLQWIEWVPDDVEARQNLARLYVEAGNTQAAVQELCQAAEQQGARGEVEGQVQTYRTALEFLPLDSPQTRQIIERLCACGRKDVAVAALEGLLWSQEQSGKVEETLATLALLVELAPDRTDWRKRHARLLARKENYAAQIQAALDIGDDPEAARLFSRVLEMDPTNLEMHERWVQFLYSRNRPEEGHQALVTLTDFLSEERKTKQAIELLSEALEKHPTAAILHARLGDFHLATNAKGRAITSFKHAARLFVQQGDVPAYHAAIEKILAIDPLDVAIRAAFVDSLLASGQVSQALVHARVLANNYIERNLFDLAEAECRLIVSQEPGDLATWKKILELAERMGDQREHIPDYLLVAEMVARRGLLDEAVHLYQQVIQLDPNNLEARRAYVESCEQMGIETDLVADYLELADLLATQGYVEEGYGYYKRVLAVDPQNAQAITQMNRLKPMLSHDMTGTIRGRSRPKSDDAVILQEAIENYARILDANPDNALVRSQMADLLFELGKIEEALTEWDKASARFFDNGDVHSAIHLCEKILQIDPNRPDVRDRLDRGKLKKDSMDAIDMAIESLGDITSSSEAPPHGSKRDRPPRRER
jgi:tetratricopeptide (TPR) repeat protein